MTSRKNGLIAAGALLAVAFLLSLVRVQWVALIGVYLIPLCLIAMVVILVRTRPRGSAELAPDSQDSPHQWPASNGVLMARPTDGFAVASLVLGILGISLLGIIFGAIGLNRTKDGLRDGRGFATGGIIVSTIWIALSIAALAFLYAS